MTNLDADLRRLKALHRRALAPLVRAALAQADPDLREFAAALPAEVDSVEAHLKNFWARKGLTEAQVADFARRYGRALAAHPPFRAFEAAMEQLGRQAGTAAFAPALAAAADRLGLDPGTLR